MAKKGGKRHSAEQIVGKLRDGETMLAAGKDLAHVLQALAVSEATWHRWRQQYGDAREGGVAGVVQPFLSAGRQRSMERPEGLLTKFRRPSSHRTAPSVGPERGSITLNAKLKSAVDLGRPKALIRRRIAASYLTGVGYRRAEPRRIE